MRKQYEKPILETIDFKIEEKIMDVEITSDGGSIDVEVDDDW